MNNEAEREELALVIVEAYGEDAETECPCKQDLEVAEAILAAGYSKPRIITTVEELDALPSGTKLFAPDTGEVWWVRERHDKSPRWQGSGGMYTHTSDLLEYQGELTALYTPDVSA